MTESFYASFNKTVTGNLARPVGYSFPENFVVNGVCKTGEKNFRLFGSVGSTLYSYTLDPDTMALDYHGVASSSWGGGDAKPVLIAASGNLELLKFGRNDPTIAMYDSSTHTLLWEWKGWTNSSYFPVSYSTGGYWRIGSLWAASDKVFFLGVQASKSSPYPTRAEFYAFTYAEIFACTTLELFTGKFTAGARSTQTVGYMFTSTGLCQPVAHSIGGPEEGSLYVGETDTHYIFYYCETPSTSYNRSFHLRLQRNTLQF